MRGCLLKTAISCLGSPGHAECNWFCKAGEYSVVKNHGGDHTQGLQFRHVALALWWDVNCPMHWEHRDSFVSLNNLCTVVCGM